MALIDVVETTMGGATTLAETVRMALAEVARTAEEYGDVDILRDTTHISHVARRIVVSSRPRLVP